MKKSGSSDPLKDTANIKKEFKKIKRTSGGRRKKGR